MVLGMSTDFIWNSSDSYCHWTLSPGNVLTSIHEWINSHNNPNEKTETQRCQQLIQGPLAHKGHSQGSSSEGLSLEPAHSTWHSRVICAFTYQHTNTLFFLSLSLNLKAVLLGNTELWAMVRIIQLKLWVLLQFSISFWYWGSGPKLMSAKII